MAFSVTSWFVDQCNEPHPPLVRKFFINSTDYSDYVTKWPRIKRDWSNVRPVSATINLNNAEQTFNFFHTEKTNLMGNGALEIGLTHPDSGNELISLFSGKIERVKLSGKSASITITDKTKAFSELQLGTNENVLDYTTSNYLPSDLIWYIVTSYGGFDATASSANTDIDYPSFETWAGVFSGDNIRMQAYFEGTKITEALRKMARITRSAIFLKDNKLSFHRFSLADSHQTELTYSKLFGVNLLLDDKSVINRQYVLGDYDQTSDYHSITCVSTDTASINSYGEREQTEEDNSIWYVDSASAINLAERIINVSKNPYSNYEVTSNLEGVIRQIGETILLTDGFFGEGGSAYRVMKNEIDMHTGRVKIGCDATQILNAFTLNQSALDSSDVLL